MLGSLADHILDTFTEALTIEVGGATDSYGEHTGLDSYGTVGRVEPLTGYSYTNQGATITAQAKLYLEAGAPIEAGAKVTWVAQGVTYIAAQGGAMVDHTGKITHQEWLLRYGDS